MERAAVHYASMLFLQRVRTAADRAFIMSVFGDVWKRPLRLPTPSPILVAPDAVQVGWSRLQRSPTGASGRLPPSGLSTCSCIFAKVGHPIGQKIIVVADAVRALCRVRHVREPAAAAGPSQCAGVACTVHATVLDVHPGWTAGFR
jgi:hypothetical protein